MAATADLKSKEKPDQLLVDDINNSKRVATGWLDDKKAYTFTLQLGAKMQWRQYKGGMWRRDPNFQASLTNEGDKGYLHFAAVHVNVGPFTGKLINGLISGMAKWLVANREKKPGAGQIDRQLLVLDVVESNERPIDAKEAINPALAAQIEAMRTALDPTKLGDAIGKAVTDGVAQVLEALGVKELLQTQIEGAPAETESKGKSKGGGNNKDNPQT